MPTRPSAYSRAPSHDHAGSAEAVGRHAGKNAEHAPGQVLHRQREGEGFACPALGLGDGLQPQAEAVAYAHGQRDDGGAADQHLEHREFFGFGSHGLGAASGGEKRVRNGGKHAIPGL
jgi:hypothetical protein